MELKYAKIRQQNRDIALMLIVPVAIIGKIIQFFILPEKYFYDRTRMILMLNKVDFDGACKGYNTTVNIFSKINVFHLTTLRQWSVCLGIIGTMILIIIISRVKEMDISEAIFTLMSAGLFNIYVFKIAK